MITSEQLAEARKDLGRQLAAWRKAAGYTQVSFAAPNGPAGYSRSAIANVETGRENMPRGFWEICDRELGADGALLAAHDHVDGLVRQYRQERTRRQPGGGEFGRPVLANAHPALGAGETVAAAAGTAGQARPAPRDPDGVAGDWASTFEVLERSMSIGSMLARTRPSQGGWLHGKLSDLEAAHHRHRPDADIALLRRAYRVAEQLHRGRTRRSGEPFPTQPVAVAHTVAELGLDSLAVAVALLHDVVEDVTDPAPSSTAYTLDHLRDDFGEPVATLVRKVAQLDAIYLAAAAGTETFPDAVRAMLIATRTDVRAILVKIVYRLHRVRALRFRREPSQIHTATVTRDLVIPLADRLGLHTIRRELEDLVLATLEPEIYRQIDDHLRRSDQSRLARVTAASQQLAAGLAQRRIRAEVHDLPRHRSAVYRQMVKDPRSGPRNPACLVVVVDGDDLDCYRALGAVHAIWRPVPGQFTDLIAAPRYQLYQSLHTTVAGPGDAPLDVRVRTGRMHRVAETGVAAALSEGELVDRVLAAPEELTGSAGRPVPTNRAARQIAVRTADGTVLPMPAGATPLDLAHCLDPTSADRLVGANVNGRLGSPTAILADGDRVELIYARHADYASLAARASR